MASPGHQGGHDQTSRGQAGWEGVQIGREGQEVPVCGPPGGCWLARSGLTDSASAVVGCSVCFSCVGSETIFSPANQSTKDEVHIEKRIS